MPAKASGRTYSFVGNPEVAIDSLAATYNLALPAATGAA